jgi:hypothetical protein
MHIFMTVPFFMLIFIFPASLLAKREHPEKWYQQKWCEAQKGQVEVALSGSSLFNHLTIRPINYLT